MSEYNVNELSPDELEQVSGGARAEKAKAATKCSGNSHTWRNVKNNSLANGVACCELVCANCGAKGYSVNGKNVSKSEYNLALANGLR